MFWRNATTVGLWVRLLARTRLELFLVITWKDLVIEGECLTFLSPEPAILLVSSKNRDLSFKTSSLVISDLPANVKNLIGREYQTSTQQMR